MRLILCTATFVTLTHTRRHLFAQAYELRFSHLVGYGAKYYAYLISRAIAASIWRKYFESDPFSRTEGERYRRECLAHGGGVPTKILARNFLQHEITADFLTKGFLNDIEQSNEMMKRYASATQ